MSKKKKTNTTLSISEIAKRADSTLLYTRMRRRRDGVTAKSMRHDDAVKVADVVQNALSELIGSDYKVTVSITKTSEKD